LFDNYRVKVIYVNPQTKSDLIKLAIAILVPLGAWFALGMPTDKAAVAVLCASIVGSVVAYLQGLISGVQTLFGKIFRKKN
jgi:hypothetical protein